MAIGAPVTAMDVDGDVLNYRLGPDADGDNEDFTIDQATGQIKTGIPLDYETPADVGGDNIYEVTVTAFDSSGRPTEPGITVSITVSDVNEPPTFAGTSPAMGAKAVDHMEGETAIDLDAGTRDDQATYTATDPESGAVSLSLGGADADMFKLTPADPPMTNVRVLSFTEAPDFENPSDANGDNIYEVTVVASDGGRTATRSATVKVIDDTAEKGKITLSSQEALIGTAITATLTDSDGGAHPTSYKVYPSDGISRVTWEWHRLAAANTAIGAETLIDDSNSATYTPTRDDDGKFAGGAGELLRPNLQ